MPWFPSLRYSSTERHVQVPAEARHVMEWLTDHDRRAEEWLQRIQGSAMAEDPRVTPLPNGGVRLDAAYVTGKDWVRRMRHEDLDSWSRGFERIHLVEFFHEGRPRLGYAMREQVTLEAGPDGTGVTVTMKGRMTGKSLLRAFLGRDADRDNRLVERHLAHQADFRIGELTSHFTTPEPPVTTPEPPVTTPEPPA